MHTSLVAEALAMALVSGDLKSSQDHQERFVLAKKLESDQVLLETSSQTCRTSKHYYGTLLWKDLLVWTRLKAHLVGGKGFHIGHLMSPSCIT